MRSRRSKTADWSGKRIERETKIDAIGKTKKQVRRRKKGEEDVRYSCHDRQVFFGR